MSSVAKAVAMAVSSIEGISLSLDGDNQASLKEKDELDPNMKSIQNV